MLNRIITATGGTDNGLQSELASSEPKKANLASFATEGVRAIEGAAVSVIDLARSRVAFWLAVGIAAPLATFNGIGQTLITFTPQSGVPGGNVWAMDGGFTPAVQAVIGHPAYWESDNGSGAPSDVAEVVAVAGSALVDPFGLHASVVRSETPVLTVQQLLGRIEDALAKEVNALNSAVILFRQDTGALMVRVGPTAQILLQAVVTDAAGSLAKFNGEAVAASGAVRLIGE